MPAIAVERTIGETKRAVLGGLIGYNETKMGKQRYRRFAVSLREKRKIVGGVVGEVWMTVLFIQLFWIDERFRGKGRGAALIRRIEDQARRFGAVRSYVDTMSVQAPGFYRKCGYKGYPGGVTRHWLTKAL
jgi:GNAT superfamily N-acetyltransferase